MTERTPLPNRRPNATRTVSLSGRKFLVTVGFDHEGNPREAFASGFLDGSDMQMIVDDACVVVSIALQHGIAPETLAKSLGTVPAWHPQGERQVPASPIGAIIAAIQAETQGKD